MSGILGGIRKAAARRVLTGREIALPEFDGTDTARWRTRDAGPLRLAGLRAGMRLGRWGRARHLVVILGWTDADGLAAALNSHPQARAVPSFDLFAVLRAGLAPGVPSLIRLYAGAFRDTGGRWNGWRMSRARGGSERGVRCLALSWPHDIPTDARALLDGLRAVCGEHTLRIAWAGGAVPFDLRKAVPPRDWCDLPDGEGRLKTLLDFAGLSAEDLPIEVDPPRDIGLDRVHVLSCLSVTHDLPLLSHFLNHYTGLGVAPGNIHVILNARDTDAPGLATARGLLSAHGAADPVEWIGPYSSTEMWERRRDLQCTRTGPGDWVISADVDELQVYPDGIESVLRDMRTFDADWLQGPMIDHVGEGGTLRAVAPAPSLWEQFPVEGDLMCQISRRPELKDGGGTVKAMLMASHLLPGLGGHGLAQAECAARARGMADALGIAPDRPQTALERSLARACGMAAAPLLGSNIGGHPRITDAPFRLSFPVHVAHFKWRDVLVEELARRRASGLQTEAASQYSTILQDFLRDRNRIDLNRMILLRDWHRPMGRAAHLAAQRAWAAARKEQNAERPERHIRHLPRAESDWRVRQLSFGSAAGKGHFHSYYDIPVLNAAETHVAAIRYDTPHRPLTPADGVTVGTVGLDGGGFRPLARSHAWSWQQGPMAQWRPGRDTLIWNDREGDRFVARMGSIDTEDMTTLDRPVYALSPCGSHALSLDFARLDTMRPGYGYAGGKGGEMEAAPTADGIWRMELETGDSTLILPIAQAVDALRRVLTEEERAAHATGGFTYWFNHCKISPNGARFTVKLRWRKPGGPWNGTMGVSLTCGLDGSTPRVIARASSHVIWLDDRHLYLWNQGAGHVGLIEDVEATEAPNAEIFDRSIFDANVHLRHVPDDPDRMVFDTPYAETVHLKLFDRATGHARKIARFGGHIPERGQFRCDLHPVPTRDGRRIVISSLADGMRQIYVVERT